MQNFRLLNGDPVHSETLSEPQIDTQILAIVMRIGIELNGTKVSARTKAITFSVPNDRLNLHDEMIRIYWEKDLAMLLLSP